MFNVFFFPAKRPSQPTMDFHHTQQTLTRECLQLLPGITEVRAVLIFSIEKLMLANLKLKKDFVIRILYTAHCVYVKC